MSSCLCLNLSTFLFRVQAQAEHRLLFAPNVHALLADNDSQVIRRSKKHAIFQHFFQLDFILDQLRSNSSARFARNHDCIEKERHRILARCNFCCTQRFPHSLEAIFRVTWQASTTGGDAFSRVECGFSFHSFSRVKINLSRPQWQTMTTISTNVRASLPKIPDIKALGSKIKEINNWCPQNYLPTLFVLTGWY